MSTTSLTTAALVLAALATPTALAYDVFDVLWVSEDGLAVNGEPADAGTVYIYRGEPEPSEDAAAEEPASEDASSSSTRVDALGLATVVVPVELPAVPVVAPLLESLPLPDVVTLVDDAVPAAAPAPAPAPAPASAPEPVFVPLVVPPEPTVPAAAVAAGAVTVAAAGAASTTGATLWERLRRVGIVALLYSRIAKERLLDHGSRERLLETIRARPGLAVQDLSEVTDIPRNTVTYHLRVLERESLVSSQRQGRNRLFFAPGSLPQKQNADAIATLRHETTLKMAQAIGATPGLDQKALCAQVGVSPSLAHWHADRLVASGVVDKRREGRFVRYYPGTAFTVVASRS